MRMELNHYKELQCSHAAGVDRLGIIGGLARTTLQYPTANVVMQVLNQVCVGVRSKTRRGTDLLALLQRRLLGRAVFGKLRDVVVARRLIELALQMVYLVNGITNIGTLWFCWCKSHTVCVSNLHYLGCNSFCLFFPME